MDRGAWQATGQGVTKSQTRLSDIHFPLSCILIVSISFTIGTFVFDDSQLIIFSFFFLFERISVAFYILE